MGHEKYKWFMNHIIILAWSTVDWEPCKVLISIWLVLGRSQLFWTIQSYFMQVIYRQDAIWHASIVLCDSWLYKQRFHGPYHMEHMKKWLKNWSYIDDAKYIVECKMINSEPRVLRLKLQFYYWHYLNRLYVVENNR